MSLSLYDYQAEAVEKLHNGSILCGGVGSGKSRTAIAYYFCKECEGMIDGTKFGFSSDYVPMKKPKDLYIITTARKRDTLEWEAECTPFLISNDSEIYDTKVFIDSWNNIKKYVDVKDSFFIFDEQRVVGHGEWTKAFAKITKQNHWILLSATPGDTWTDYIPVFLANGFYKNRTDFYDQHVIYNYYFKYPKIDHYVNQRKLIFFRDSILVTMDYEKPTVSHNEIIHVDYDKEKYQDIMRRRWNIFKDEPIATASELCGTLRKVVNSDFSREEAVRSFAFIHKRLIIFYNFNYELDILKNIDYGEGFVVAEWNGHVHEPIPDSEKWVYLVQYTAGAEGWNCTLTNVIIFYSQSYSYKTMVQAAGRIDRLNTPYKDLYYYHLRSSASIDIAISRALRQKKNFNESSFVKK